jgi:hypothetical protein
LNSLSSILAKIVIHAWEAREVTLMQPEESLSPPRIVSYIRHKLAQTAPNTEQGVEKQFSGDLGIGIDNFPMSIPVDFDTQSLLYSLGGQMGYTGAEPGGFL